MARGSAEPSAADRERNDKRLFGVTGGLLPKQPPSDVKEGRRRFLGEKGDRHVFLSMPANVYVPFYVSPFTWFFQTPLDKWAVMERIMIQTQRFTLPAFA